MSPGQGLICRSCFHRLTTLFEQGHTSPCSLVGWHGARHHKPALAENGRSCPEFLARCDFLVDEVPVDVDSASCAARGEAFGSGVV